MSTPQVTLIIYLSKWLHRVPDWKQNDKLLECVRLFAADILSNLQRKLLLHNNLCSWAKRVLNTGSLPGRYLHAVFTGSINFIWISNLITQEVFNHPHFYLFDINMLIDRVCWPAWSLQDREKLIKTTRDYSSHHLPNPCRFLYYTAW